MIGTDEGRGIADIGPAQPVAAVAADVEKGADLPRAVPHHQDRVLAHVGTEEVAGVGDLALVAQKQPATGEDPLQLLRIDLRFDKDTSTDQAVLGIHQTPGIRHHATPPYAGSGQPALRVLVPHIGPHFIDFRFINPLDHHVHIGRM